MFLATTLVLGEVLACDLEAFVRLLLQVVLPLLLACRTSLLSSLTILWAIGTKSAENRKVPVFVRFTKKKKLIVKLLKPL